MKHYKSKYTNLKEATPESNSKMTDLLSEFNRAFKNSILFVVMDEDNSYTTNGKPQLQYTFSFRTSIKDDPLIKDIIYDGDKMTIIPSQEAFDKAKEILNAQGFDNLEFNNNQILVSAGEIPQSVDETEEQGQPEDEK